MKVSLRIAFANIGVGICLIGSAPVVGQIVINEVVKEERTASGGVVAADTREFVELYNTGNAAVDLTDWSLVTFDITAGSPASSYVFPSGSMIQPGGYFVIGDAGVTNVNFTPTAGDEMWPDLVASALELRSGPDPFSSPLEDAVAYEIYRAGETGLSLVPQTLIDQIGSGYQASPISPNNNASNPRLSWARYRDGVDSDANGIDFGMLPLTPGASNEVFPQNASHTVPDVDSLAAGTALSSQYYASFVLPRVIDPTVATAINPRALPEPSPQGGNAIIAWDETGGGNAVYSRELVNAFHLYAYFDTTPIGVATATSDREYETVVYGIGTVDPLFENPDPTGTIPDAEVGPFTRSGTTGIGWMYQQFETNHADDAAVADFSKLFLVDFGDSGNSDASAADEDWDIIQEIDMSALSSDWYRLGLDYDPVTGEVTATFDDQEFTFTLAYDLVGTFYVGHREGISGSPSTSGRFPLHNPAIYDLFEEDAPVLAGDYNDDGTVNAADYTVWRDRFGATTELPNETVTPGMVTQEDYDAWKSNFGAMGSGAAIGAGAVPEPSSVVLGLVGMLLAAARMRRRD